jgi:dihydrofolate synthase/folylpolyglutamate synthase
MRSLNDWLAQQLAQHPKEIDLSLERVRAVAQRLGLLPWRLPTVIVGGTNGKGSTVAMLTALGRAAGLRTGTYTSPHLQRYNERVAIDAVPIDDAALCAAFERIESARSQGEAAISLTFFEWGTLAAFDIFAREAVDLVVLEVGLGGRLDATNIVDADVAVLCSVSLDHTEWLGPTVEHIGAEKAGIFRPGRPVILGSADLPRSVYAALESLACDARRPGREFEVREQGVGSWVWAAGARALGPLPFPALEGPVQLANAAAALAAFDALGRVPLTTEIAARALRDVRLRGRFQRVAEFPVGGPQWILDVAHNVGAAEALAQTLRATPCAGRTVAVVGILADKDAHAIGAALAAVVDEWVLAGLDGPRGCDAERLRRRLPDDCRSTVLAPNVHEACAAALALAERGDRIVVLGSFHTIGPALDWLGL